MKIGRDYICQDCCGQIAYNMEEMKEITFAKGFGRITDMQLGPDGNLYILSSGDKGAHVDRIVSTNSH